ncbi:MAG: hypothetical protein H7Y07_02845 [Pyrinomonadaceae bacterium]|nr:hypothetical protein [Sphingobacteriaceae bacterium]
MNRKALLCILITYGVTALHCVLTLIQTFHNLGYSPPIQYILMQGAFLISASLLIETIVFSLVLMFRIRSYWKLFAPIMLFTAIITGHYLVNINKPLNPNNISVIRRVI